MSATMTSGTKTAITMKLPQLQNLCKRDPAGYKVDYQAQRSRFTSELAILLLNPSRPAPRFIDLMQFVTNVVSNAYKSDGAEVAKEIISLLHTNGGDLHGEVRRTAAQSLILMRNRAILEPAAVLELFFDLMSVNDKVLRRTVTKHIINDIKNLNKKQTNEKVNKRLQTYMHKIISNSNERNKANFGARGNVQDIAAKRCCDITAELYRKNIWVDSHAVGIMSTAALSPITSIMVRSIHFFLGIEDQMMTDKSEEEDNEWAGVNDIDFHQFSRKTKKRTKGIKKQIENRKRTQMKRERKDPEEAQKFLYPAIESLNDPHSLAERLLKRMKTSSSNVYKFDTKLIMLNFITRLIGIHKLIILPLYPFLQRYLGGHQKDVTNILAHTVQASHELVPPQELKGIVKTIAFNFISERCTPEQMAVGINACKAICIRVPALLADTEDENDTDTAGAVQGRAGAMDMEGFAQDIAAFARNKDKSVQVAAKGWVNFVRETHPKLLKGKDRGLVGAGVVRSGERPLKYGEVKASKGVEGAELLLEYERKKAEKRARMVEREENGDEEDWDDMEEGWNDVSSDEEDMNDDKEIEEEEEEEESGSDDDEEEEEGVEATSEDEWIEIDSNDEESEEQEGEDGKETPLGDDGWEEVESGAESSDGSDEEEESDDDDDDDDEEAPQLVEVDEKSIVPPPNKRQRTQMRIAARKAAGNQAPRAGDKKAADDLAIENARLEVSSTRIFSAADFSKMRKLSAKAKEEVKNPRLLAKRKRQEAKGEFEELSGDDSDMESDQEDGFFEDDGDLRTKTIINPTDIQSEARRKRQSKIERIESVVAGREKHENKQRDGGSTNTEKLRKKNFMMQKRSFLNVRKMANEKQTRFNGAGRQKSKSQNGKKDSDRNKSKRRRK